MRRDKLSRNRKGIHCTPRNLAALVRAEFREEMWMTPLSRRRHFHEISDPPRASKTGGLTTQWLRFRATICAGRTLKRIAAPGIP